jgi:cytochrome c551
LKQKIAIFSLISLFSCQSKEEIRREQMIVNGKEIYDQHCANCHQKDGLGVGSLYPPIANNVDFLNNTNQVICIIKNGISGEMIVNGKRYNQAMPANRQLFDLDIAAVVTYIQAQWGNKNLPTVEADDVKKVICPNN